MPPIGSGQDPADTSRFGGVRLWFGSSFHRTANVVISVTVKVLRQRRIRGLATFENAPGLDLQCPHCLTK
jgi:hypothetical protein